jgi:hypothetical protein
MEDVNDTRCSVLFQTDGFVIIAIVLHQQPHHRILFPSRLTPTSYSFVSNFAILSRTPLPSLPFLVIRLVVADTKGVEKLLDAVLTSPSPPSSVSKPTSYSSIASAPLPTTPSSQSFFLLTLQRNTKTAGMV